MHVGLPAKLLFAALPALTIASSPGPLEGVPLEGDTGIRLVVAYAPPFVLDVDSARVTHVRGVPTRRDAVVRVTGLGARTAIIVAGLWRHESVFALRAGGALSRLGPGSEVAAAMDGRSVWIERFVRPARCTLRQVRQDGRLLRAPRAFPCSPMIYLGGSLGLGVSPRRIINPVTRRTVFRTRSNIVAVAGKSVVLTNGPGRRFAVVDTATGTERQFDWPETPGSLRWTPVDVQGRFVALEFGNPSWTGAGGQAWDVWVLDTRTAKLVELPSLPAFVWLKWTNMAWTGDGNLVFLTRNDERQIVAVWRPGQDRLHLKTVRLPNRNGVASSSFAILR